MRHDYFQAVRELERLQVALSASAGLPEVERLARCYALSSLFEDDDLIRDAALSVLGTAGQPSHEARERMLVARFVTRNKEQVRSQLLLFVELLKSPAVKEHYDLVKEAILPIRARYGQWQGETLSVQLVTAWLRENETWSLTKGECLDIEPKILRVVHTALVNMLHALPIEVGMPLHASITNVERAFATLCNGLRDELADFKLYESLAIRVDLANGYELFRQVNRGMAALKALEHDARLDSLVMMCRNLETYLPLIERLISATISRLRLRPLEMHAIRRLKTHLQQWEGERIIERLNNDIGLRPESELQHVVDRFLFAEGFFPITHAVAGTGFIDTFIAGSKHLIDEASGSGQPSILIELKQALTRLNNPTTEGRVRTAVTSAIQQADEYSSAIKANPAWTDHAAHAVVVYDGTTRYRVKDNPDVTLIYIGKARPSDGTKELVL